MTAAVAIPAEYRDDLAPVLLTFTLATDDEALDLTEVVSVRAIVERSDRETLEWAFDIETSDPAPTATEIVVSHTAEISAASLTVTLEGMALVATSRARASASVVAPLDGIGFAATSRARVSASLVATLDHVACVATATARARAALNASLDGVAFVAATRAIARASLQVVLEDTTVAAVAVQSANVPPFTVPGLATTTHAAAHPRSETRVAERPRAMQRAATATVAVTVSSARPVSATSSTTRPRVLVR